MVLHQQATTVELQSYSCGFQRQAEIVQLENRYSVVEIGHTASNHSTYFSFSFVFLLIVVPLSQSNSLSVTFLHHTLIDATENHIISL